MPSIHLSKSSNVIFTLGGDDGDDKDDDKDDEYYKIGNSEKEIHMLHKKLIAFLELAIEEQQADEFERYGLEFLSEHYYVEGIHSGDGQKLLDLAYSQSHWQRQLKISKGYTWTKNGLKAVISWASKYKEDEVIECGLQMVDLHHQEQHDAPQIVALVTEGDFDSALKRIEQFGGNDKESLQRKFILYMLCLMELTLLDSKDKPNRKEGIEKLLKHLDEKLPENQPVLNIGDVNHSILIWDEFFPSYLMFKISCELSVLGLDYLILYKRSDNWENTWISEKKIFTDLEFDVLMESTSVISNELEKDSIQKDVLIKMAKQGKCDKALKYNREVNNKFYKHLALVGISIELAKQEKIKESLACAKGISDDYSKSSALSSIATELTKCGKIDEALSVLNEAYTCALAINSNHLKSNLLKDISIELFKIGENEISASSLKESFLCARSLNNYQFALEKCIMLKKISIELAKHAKLGMFEEAIECLKAIEDESEMINALNEISIELARIGKFEEALKCALSINNESEKSCVLMEISIEMIEKGKFNESLVCVSEISDAYWKNRLLKIISKEFAKIR